MLKFNRILLVLVLVTSLGCNKNNNTWLGRRYQDMVARYNVYFNGKEKLKEVVRALEASHTDNYKEILEVYPWGTDEGKKAQTGQIDEIVKKASKVIDGKPLSKWVDDAYFLMGKAYYFKADYFAAIETFQYINAKYKNSLLAYESTIWIIMCYNRQGKSGEAEAIIGLLKNDLQFPKKLQTQLNIAAAEVYVRQKKYPAAIEKLTLVLKEGKGLKHKSRYNYILGQLYEATKQPLKARECFQAVLKSSPPYEMAFNAKVNLARNYDPNDKGQIRSARKYLRSMLKDDKNVAFYDQVYYELGNIDRKESNYPDAEKNYKMSVASSQNNEKQRALSYLALADMYFTIPNYPLAQAYYDSTVFFIKPDFENYEQLKLKQGVLTELIKNLLVIQREDSLLKLANMSPKDLEREIDRAVSAEKKRKEKEEENRKALANQQNNTNNNLLNDKNPLQTQPGGSNWYFYDPVVVSKGYNDFMQRWGKRKLVDNWRYASAQQGSTEDPENTAPKEDNPEKMTDGSGKDIPIDRQKYYQDIPFEKEAQQFSNERISTAYFNVGVVYFEQLKENTEAITSFTTLVNRYPEGKETPQGLYYLTRIYQLTGDSVKFDFYLNELVTRFPESNFAKIAGAKKAVDTGEAQPPTEKEEANKEIVRFYEATYQLYKEGKYEEVKTRKKLNDQKYFGSSLQGRFELLYALTLSKTDSIPVVIKQLELVVENYSPSEVAQTAKNMLDAYRKSTGKGPENGTNPEAANFKYNPSGIHYFILVVPDMRENMNAIKAKFSDYNKEFNNAESFAVESMLIGKQQALVVKQFTNKDKAAAYLGNVNSHKKFTESLGLKDFQVYIIDTKNWAQVIITKDMDAYRTFYQSYYLK